MDTKPHICKHRFIILSSRIRNRRFFLPIRPQDFEIGNNATVCTLKFFFTSACLPNENNKWVYTPLMKFIGWTTTSSVEQFQCPENKVNCSKIVDQLSKYMSTVVFSVDDCFCNSFVKFNSKALTHIIEECTLMK